MNGNRVLMLAGLAFAACVIASATRGLADEAPPGPEGTHGATVSGTATATAGVDAREDLEALRRKIDEQGRKVSAEARVKAEAQIEASGRDVDKQAAADGDAKVAARLAEEFGLSADAILAQKAALGASWGELTIAHCLAANAKADVTVEQLMALREEREGWGRIAAGLELSLGSAVSAIRAESRVARGLVRPDGRVAAMAGAGARGRAGVDAGLRTGAIQGRAGVQTGVGAGLRVGGKDKP